jgi:hypothetical protein
MKDLNDDLIEPWQKARHRAPAHRTRREAYLNELCVKGEHRAVQANVQASSPGAHREVGQGPQPTCSLDGILCQKARCPNRDLPRAMGTFRISTPS